MRVAFLLLLFAAALAALVYVLWRIRDRPAFLLLAATTAIVAIAGWVAILMLMASDPTGAGGASDCWPDCSLYQDVVWAGFVALPVVLGVLLLAVGAIAVIRKKSRSR